MRLIAFVLAVLLSFSVAAQGQTGIASYYGKKFHGRTTASGSRFDMYQLTAAHRSFPFGTKLIVTAVHTGKTVEVVVTDRGPFVKGRIIDLSYVAALKLGIVSAGIAEVVIDIAR